MATIPEIHGYGGEYTWTSLVSGREFMASLSERRGCWFVSAQSTPGGSVWEERGDYPDVAIERVVAMLEDSEAESVALAENAARSIVGAVSGMLAMQGGMNGKV